MRELYLQVWRHCKQAAIKCTVVNRVQTEPIPRIRSVLHVVFPRHNVASIQKLRDRKPGDAASGTVGSQDSRTEETLIHARSNHCLARPALREDLRILDRKSTRLNSSHLVIS